MKSNWPPAFTKGDTLDVQQRIGEALCRMGVAIEVVDGDQIYVQEQSEIEEIQFSDQESE